jgi:exopolysaccharide production protein ExoZ
MTHSFIYLQYLRGVAALMVVYYHSVVQLKNFGIENPLLPQIGESGVDLFFVLSGFLMWITTSGKEVSPGSFMLKRLMRIAPLYWMLTLVAGAAALVAPELLKHTLFSTQHFLSSMLFFPAENPSYLDPSEAGLRLTPILVPGWTLNYEMFFYMIFAAALFFPQRLRLWLVAGAFILITLLGTLDGQSNDALLFYGNPIVFEFIMGIAVAILVKRRQMLDAHWAMLMTALAIALMLLANINHLDISRPVAYGIPAAFIVYGLCCMEIRGVLRNFKGLRVVGDASYSLYLTHVFTLVVCRLIFAHFYQVDSVMAEIAFVVLCLALSMTIGVITYYLYEKPATGWLNKFQARAVVPANVRT